MSQQVPRFSRRPSNSFRKITDRFLHQQGLPFEQTLSADQIQKVFEQHDGMFAVGAIYGTAVVLGALLKCYKTGRWPLAKRRKSLVV